MSSPTAWPDCRHACPKPAADRLRSGREGCQPARPWGTCRQPCPPSNASLAFASGCSGSAGELYLTFEHHIGLVVQALAIALPSTAAIRQQFPAQQQDQALRVHRLGLVAFFRKMVDQV